MRQVTARVKYPAENRTAASGRSYSSVGIEIQGEGLTRLFGPPNHGPFQQLQTGQEIIVALDGQGKAHLIENASVQPMGFQAQPHQHQPQVPQQYQQQPAPAAAPAAAAADPVIALASAWHRAFTHLTGLGVDPTLAAPAASTITIQLGRGR